MQNALPIRSFTSRIAQGAEISGPRRQTRSPIPLPEMSADSRIREGSTATSTGQMVGPFRGVAIYEACQAETTRLELNGLYSRIYIPPPLGDRRRPAHDLGDPTEDFLGFLLVPTEYDSDRPSLLFAGPPLSVRFDERSIPDEIASRKYSLIESTGVPDWIWTYVERNHLLVKAIADGIPRREAAVLHYLWHLFRVRWCGPEQPIYHEHFLHHSIHGSILMFWVALRRGWGPRVPTDNFLTQTRTFFIRFWGAHDYAGTDTGVSTGNNDGIFAITLDEQLSTRERERLLGLESLYNHPNRVGNLHQQWRRFPPRVESSRDPVLEAHFSGAQLRLDRLERLIREERVLNAEISTHD